MSLSCPFCKATLGVVATPATMVWVAPQLTQGYVAGLTLVAPPPVVVPAPVLEPLPAPDPTPIQEPIAMGIPIVVFNTPAADLAAGTAPYRGTVIAYSGLSLAYLTAIQKRGGQVIIALSRSGSKDANGLSVSKATATINAYNATMLKPFIGNTIIGLMIADDITHTSWGNISLAERLNRWDLIAGAAKSHLSGIRTLIRARPGEMASHTWKNKIVAWSQYSNRKGDVTAYRDGDVALAAKLGMGLIFGLNVINGGDGSSGIKGFTGWMMSAAEILRYGKALLPKSHVFTSWRYTTNMTTADVPSGTSTATLAAIKAYDSLAAIRAAFKELQALGATLARPALL